jgi:hypothetical protein
VRRFADNVGGHDHSAIENDPDPVRKRDSLADAPRKRVLSGALRTFRGKSDRGWRK